VDRGVRALWRREGGMVRLLLGREEGQGRDGHQQGGST
jgi:hypothetical protein